MAPAIVSEIHRTLAKRDNNMGYDIPPAAIVLLVMLGAGVALLMCFAATRFLFDDKEPPAGRSAAQDDYMREVRARNLDTIVGESMRQYKNHAKPPSFASDSRS